MRHPLRQEAALLYSWPGHRQQLLAAPQRCEIYEGPFLVEMSSEFFHSYFFILHLSEHAYDTLRCRHQQHLLLRLAEGVRVQASTIR